ncbi:MAG: hypothetical protein ACOVOR_03535 [Rhabdochlamydiaceae bacterium]
MRKEYGLSSAIDLRQIEDDLEKRISGTDPSLQKKLEEEFPDVWEQVSDYFNKTDGCWYISKKVSSCIKNPRPW